MLTDSLVVENLYFLTNSCFGSHVYQLKEASGLFLSIKQLPKGFSILSFIIYSSAPVEDITLSLKGVETY